MHYNSFHFLGELDEKITSAIIYYFIQKLAELSIKTGIRGQS